VQVKKFIDKGLDVLGLSCPPHSQEKILTMDKQEGKDSSAKIFRNSQHHWSNTIKRTVK